MTSATDLGGTNPSTGAAESKHVSFCSHWLGENAHRDREDHTVAYTCSPSGKAAIVTWGRRRRAARRQTSSPGTTLLVCVEALLQITGHRSQRRGFNFRRGEYGEPRFRSSAPTMSRALAKGDEQEASKARRATMWCRTTRCGGGGGVDRYLPAFAAALSELRETWRCCAGAATETSLVAAWRYSHSRLQCASNGARPLRGAPLAVEWTPQQFQAQCCWC